MTASFHIEPGSTTFTSNGQGLDSPSPRWWPHLYRAPISEDVWGLTGRGLKDEHRCDTLGHELQPVFSTTTMWMGCWRCDLREELGVRTLTTEDAYRVYDRICFDRWKKSRGLAP